MPRRVDQRDQRGPARDLWALGVLPVLGAGALAGFLGIYWDIAWHIDKGRDTFFTPPHNFIYTNLTIVLAASVYGKCGGIAGRRPSTWRPAPTGSRPVS